MRTCQCCGVSRPLVKLLIQNVMYTNKRASADANNPFQGFSPRTTAYRVPYVRHHRVRLDVSSF